MGNLLTKTKAIPKCEVLMDAVNVYLDLLNCQIAVLECKIACAKPKKFEFMTDLAKTSKKAIFDLGKKDRQKMLHLRTLEDATALFNWFVLPDTKEDFMFNLTEMAGGMDFQGAKLTQTPNAYDKEWYRALRVVQQDFAQFVKGNYPRITKWEGDNEDVESFYEGSINGARENSSIKAPAPTPVVEEKKAEPAKPGAVAKAPVKAAAVPKEPTRVKKGKILELSNYKNETLKFEGAEVDNGTQFNFFNCEKCKVIIVGKFKNFMFQRCKRMKVFMDECISMGEIINSDDF